MRREKENKNRKINRQIQKRQKNNLPLRLTEEKQEKKRITTI